MFAVVCHALIHAHLQQKTEKIRRLFVKIHLSFVYNSLATQDNIGNKCDFIVL